MTSESPMMLEGVAQLLPSGTAERFRHTSLPRQAVTLTIGAVLACGLAGYFWLQAASASHELESRRNRAMSVASDAAAIARFRSQPASIRETEVSRADLLRQVQAAMQRAGIDANRLLSTSSEPPRRIGDAPVAEVTQRLMFNGVELEALVRFCHAVTTADQTLAISIVQLRAGSSATDWSVDLSMTYRIAQAASPTQSRQTVLVHER